MFSEYKNEIFEFNKDLNNIYYNIHLSIKNVRKLSKKAINKHIKKLKQIRKKEIK